MVTPLEWRRHFYDRTDGAALAAAVLAGVLAAATLAGAVFKGYGEVVRILFEAGADPHGGTPTAIDTARKFEKDAFLELFGV